MNDEKSMAFYEQNPVDPVFTLTVRKRIFGEYSEG